MWAGLALSYVVASLPPSTAIILTATAAYLIVGMIQALRERTPARHRILLAGRRGGAH